MLAFLTRYWFVFPLLVALSLVIPKWRWMTPHRYFAAMLAPLVIGMALIPGVMACLMFYSPNYTITSSEVGLLLSAIGLNHGYPLYSDPSQPPVLGLLYGPYAILPYSVALGVFSEVWVPKALGLGVFLLGLVLMYRSVALRTAESWKRIASMLLPWVGFTTAIPLIFNPKGDPFALTAAALPWTVKGRRFLYVSALCAAFTMDVKFTAVLAFIPNLCILWVDRKDYRWLDILTSGGMFLAVLAFPFLLPGISIHGYLHYLTLASTHRLFALQGLPALVTSAAWFIVAIAAWPVMQTNRHLKAMFIGCCIASVLFFYPAVKVGAGTYHYASLYPAIAVLLAECLEEFRASSQMKVFAPAAVFLIFAQAGLDIFDGVTNFGKDYDLARYEKGYYDEFMGMLKDIPQPYGLVPAAPNLEWGNSNYVVEDLMLPAALHNADTLISPFAQGDLIESHLLPSQAVVQALRDCHIKYMVMRNDSYPYLKVPIYDLSVGVKRDRKDPYYTVYGTELYTTFLQTYHPWKVHGRFTIWACNPPEIVSSESTNASDLGVSLIPSVPQ